MITDQTLKAAASSLDMAEAYGLVSRSVSTMAIMTLERLARAEDVAAAVEAEIVTLEAALLATGDYGYQNRINYTLNTLKGL